MLRHPAARESEDLPTVRPADAGRRLTEPRGQGSRRAIGSGRRDVDALPRGTAFEGARMAAVRHDDRVRVIACRGCCCGNPDKHPDTDHPGQLARLRSMVAEHPGRVEVQTSTCLGPCAQANVVVVRPSPRARRAGARAIWLALVRDPQILDVLDGWLARGGPGVARIPDLLELHVISAPRPARR